MKNHVGRNRRTILGKLQTKGSGARLSIDVGIDLLARMVTIAFIVHIDKDHIVKYL